MKVSFAPGKRGDPCIENRGRWNVPKAGWGTKADVPSDIVKWIQNPDISRLWQMRQRDPFQPTSGNTRNTELSFVNG